MPCSLKRLEYNADSNTRIAEVYEGARERHFEGQELERTTPSPIAPCAPLRPPQKPCSAKSCAVWQYKRHRSILRRAVATPNRCGYRPWPSPGRASAGARPSKRRYAVSSSRMSAREAARLKWQYVRVAADFVRILRNGADLPWLYRFLRFKQAWLLYPIYDHLLAQSDPIASSGL